MKPCPFCGADEAMLWHKGTRYGTMYIVKCDICGAQTRPSYTKQEITDENEWDNNASRTAEALWNVRNGESNA